MERREFLSGAAGFAAMASSAQAEGNTHALAQNMGAAAAPEYYLLRKYQTTRAQAAGVDHFLQEAMLPALAQLGYRDVGAFSLEYGPETPATYLLLRHAEAEKLLRLEQDLQQDGAFLRSAAAFRSAPALQPAFQRVEDTLLRAFAGHPVLQVPRAGKHILQLRTYESPSLADALLKVQMFHSGEFEIFAECGMPAVFYAHNVTGARLPALTYMLRFDNLADLENRWAQFRDNPQWKKLSTDPRFSKEDLVSHISNFLLSPKPFSAI